MDYFLGKIPRAMKAKKHTEEMRLKYTISKGTVYGEFGNDVVTNPISFEKIPNRLITTEILKCGVDQAIIHAADELPEYLYGPSENRNIWILNFASYKEPGGMFLKGSSAQEESLCHISNLYNHLANEWHYYEVNNTDLNKGLYRNRCVIHRNVMFEIPRKFDLMVRPFNVITCAAPNATAAKKYQNVSDMECKNALLDRAAFLYSVLEQQTDIDVLIFGAWGCGVFGNDAEAMANIFKELFIRMPNYKHSPHNILIIHPIPDNKNYNKFVNAYNLSNDN